MKNKLAKIVGTFGIFGIGSLGFSSYGQDNLEKTPEKIIGGMSHDLNIGLNREPSQNTFTTTRNSKGQIIKEEEKYYSSDNSQFLINHVPVDSITITRNFKYDSGGNMIKEIRFSDYHNKNLENLKETFDLSKK